MAVKQEARRVGKRHRITAQGGGRNARYTNKHRKGRHRGGKNGYRGQGR